MTTTQETATSFAALEIERELDHLGSAPSTAKLRRILNDAFVNEERSWETGEANEACELAVTRALIKEGARGGSDAQRDATISRLAGQEPRIQKRSERHDRLQHYATPIGIAWAMAIAGGIHDRNLRVMDPSAGTGMLLGAAALASADAELEANEVDGARARLLAHLAPKIDVVHGDAITFSSGKGTYANGCADVVLMNPPFSARVGTSGRHRNEDLRHLAAARPLLAPKGRIVALLGGNTKPGDKKWNEAVGTELRLQWLARIDGTMMRSRKMNVATCLCVLEQGRDTEPFDPADAETHVSAESLIAAARTMNLADPVPA